MQSADFVRLFTEALSLSLLLAGPALVVSLVVGVVVSVVQTVTQVQEQTLTFVPKLAAVAATLAFTASWMGAELVRFTTTLWGAIPGLFR